MCLDTYTFSREFLGSHPDAGGYGFAHLPMAAGTHDVEVATWCPEGTTYERVAAFFGGGRPRIKMEEIVHTQGDRFRLKVGVNPKP